MSDSAKLRTSEVLKALNDSLPVFQGESQEAFLAVHQEVKRVLNELRERENYWKIEVRRRQLAFDQIDGELKRCRSVAAAQREQGKSQFDLCAPLEAKWMKARVHLERARVGLRDTVRFITFVEGAESDFHKQELQLRNWLMQDLPKARHELQRLASLADAYGPVGGGTSGGSSSSPASPPPSSPTTTPIFSKDGHEIENVPLAQIDWQSSHVREAADFQHGVRLDEMCDGLKKLEEVVRPNVEAGKTREFFVEMDEQLGLQGNDCYAKIYDYFYGEGPGGYIKLVRQGNRYQVEWGHHRLFAANRIGLASVPAVVIDVNTSSYPVEFREGNRLGPERRI